MKCNIPPFEEDNLTEIYEMEMGFERFEEEEDDNGSVFDVIYLDENQGAEIAENEERNAGEYDPDGLAENNIDNMEMMDNKDDMENVDNVGNMENEDNNMDNESQEQQYYDMKDTVVDQHSAATLVKFIRSNLDLFANKIVMHVGCSSGLISLYCIQAGAAKVIATGYENTGVPIGMSAIDLAFNNDIFVAIKGPISEIELPIGLTHVDVIVSEWMGHAVFVGSWFKDVLYARDKWLIKGGLIIPNVGKLYLTGLYDNPIKFTEGYQGDLSEENPYSFDADNYANSRDYQVDNRPRQNLMDAHIVGEDVMTQKFLLKTIDLSTAQADEEHFKTPFQTRVLQDGQLLAFALFSEFWVAVPNRKAKRLLATGPMDPITHLKQTILILAKQPMVSKDKLLKGVFGLYHNENRYRGVEFSICLEVTDFDADLEPKNDPRTGENDFYSGLESLALLFGEEPGAELNSEVAFDQETDSEPEF